MKRLSNGAIGGIVATVLVVAIAATILLVTLLTKKKKHHRTPSAGPSSHGPSSSAGPSSNGPSSSAGPSHGPSSSTHGPSSSAGPSSAGPSRVSQYPPVLIHLPSFTDIEGAALQTLYTNVLNFIQAFNSKYASANVQIVSFSPTRVCVSGAPKQSEDDFVALARMVKTRNITQLALGISQYMDVDTQMPSIASLNASCASQGLPSFSIFITDYQDQYWHGKDLPTGLRTITSQAYKAGVTTVGIAGGPNYSAPQQLQNAFNLAAVPNVTQVGIPEIYDLAWAGCNFPPPLCHYSDAKGKDTPSCDIPTVTNAYIDAGIEALFTPSPECRAAGVKPLTDFLTANTSSFATWPGFAIEVSTDCFPSGAALTISGSAQSGCNTLFTFTVDQFVYFLRKFAAATIAGRPAATEVPIMLYEAAFIPIAWMTQVGAEYVPHP